MDTAVTVSDFAFDALSSAKNIIDCQQLANNLLAKTPNPKVAAKRLVRLTAKRSSWTSVTSLLTCQTYIPVSSKLNSLETFGTLGLQLRMVLTIATLAGYDLSDEEVKAFLSKYGALSALYGIIRPCAMQFGVKYARSLVKSIPGTALAKINKPLGHRFVTKNGHTGTINLMALVCVGGMVTSAAVDVGSTYSIGYAAIHDFFNTDNPIVEVKELSVE